MKYILIPVKDLQFAKKRLAQLLNASERTALAELMMENLFNQVARARGYDQVVVVTIYEPAIRLARSFGFEIFRETRQISESCSVDTASRSIAKWGVRSVLRLPIDLPLIRPEDIETVLAKIDNQPSAVLVPSRSKSGTNAIARTPPDLFPSRFGEDSLFLHLAEIMRCGAACKLIDLRRVALDLDDPEDILFFLKHGRGTRLYEFLQDLCVVSKGHRSHHM
jgi:2-phospho-L-lactate guanylyltransferase